jgi:hypothetical protein
VAQAIGRAGEFALMVTPFVIAQLAMLGFVFFMLLNSAAVMVYVERKVAARIQQRMGPWLVGPYGALQPLADIVKLMFKEELRPKAADSSPLRAGPGDFRGRGVHRIFRGAVRHRNHIVRPARSPCPAAGGGRERGGAGGVRGDVDGCLRHRSGRMELEQQVLLAGRAAVLGPDDQLRAVIRHGPRQRAGAGRLALAARHRQRAGRLVAARHPRAGICSCSRSGSSFS